VTEIWRGGGFRFFFPHVPLVGGLGPAVGVV